MKSCPRQYLTRLYWVCNLCNVPCWVHFPPYPCILGPKYIPITLVEVHQLLALHACFAMITETTWSVCESVNSGSEWGPLKRYSYLCTIGFLPNPIGLLPPKSFFYLFLFLFFLCCCCCLCFWRKCEGIKHKVFSMFAVDNWLSVFTKCSFTPRCGQLFSTNTFSVSIIFCSQYSAPSWEM